MKDSQEVATRSDNCFTIQSGEAYNNASAEEDDTTLECPIVA